MQVAVVGIDSGISHAVPIGLIKAKAGVNSYPFKAIGPLRPGSFPTSANIEHCLLT